MEFTVSKFDLLRELTLVQGVVERKTTIPILANVLLRSQENELGVVATDLEIGLRTTCPAKVTVPGTITLPAKRLFEIVRVLPDLEIFFKQTESNWVSITCGTSRFRIVGLPQEDFPALPEPKQDVTRVSGRALGKLISRTLFAISAEDSKYTLSGALLVMKPTSMVMVATDGHRLAYVEKPEELEDVADEVRVLVPKKAMSELLRLVEDANESEKIGFSRDENHLFFDMGQRLLVARVLVGQFPNYEAVIPRGNDRIFTVARDQIAAAIRRVALLADERAKTVKLVISAGKLEIAASHSDLGEAHETLEVEYGKEDIQIGFNYQYLLDFLSTAAEPEVSFELKDGESAAQLRALPAEEFNYRYIVMPMRI